MANKQNLKNVSSTAPPLITWVMSSCLMGLLWTPRKVAAIVYWATPKICCFLWFANFCWWFIRGFSRVVSPITHLLQKNSAYVWTLEAQLAFEQQKTLTKAPMLIYPDWSIKGDTFDYAIRSTLSQQKGVTSCSPPLHILLQEDKHPQNRTVQSMTRSCWPSRLLLRNGNIIWNMCFPFQVFTNHKK